MTTTTKLGGGGGGGGWGYNGKDLQFLFSSSSLLIHRHRPARNTEAGHIFITGYRLLTYILDQCGKCIY